MLTVTTRTPNPSRLGARRWRGAGNYIAPLRAWLPALYNATIVARKLCRCLSRLQQRCYLRNELLRSAASCCHECHWPALCRRLCVGNGMVGRRWQRRPALFLRVGWRTTVLWHVKSSALEHQVGRASARSRRSSSIVCVSALWPSGRPGTCSIAARSARRIKGGPAKRPCLHAGAAFTARS